MTLRVFRLAAVAFLLAAVAYFLGTNTTDLGVLVELRVSTLIIVAALILVSTVLYAQSMYVYLVALLPSSPGHLQWQSLVFASRLLNYTLPQGANIYRGGFLKTRYGLPIATYIGMVLFHSWIFATLTFWVAAALALAVGAESRALVACLLPAVAGTLIAPLLQLRLPAVPEDSALYWVAERFRALSETLVLLGRRYVASLKLAVIVFLTFVLTVLSVYLLLEQLVGTADVGVAVVLSIIFTLSRFINVVPANLGLTELLTGAAYEFLGGSLVVGILVSGVLRVLEFFVAIALGGVAILLSDDPLPKGDQAGINDR